MFKSYKKNLESERTAVARLDQAIYSVDEAKRFTVLEYRKKMLEAVKVILLGIREDIQENEFQTERAE